MQLNNACPDAPTIFLSLDMFPVLPSKYFTENAPQAVVIWISSQWNILRSIHINTVNNQSPSRRDHWLSAIYKGLSMAWQAKSQSCWPCWDPEPRWQFFPMKSLEPEPECFPQNCLVCFTQGNCAMGEGVKSEVTQTLFLKVLSYSLVTLNKWTPSLWWEMMVRVVARECGMASCLVTPCLTRDTLTSWSRMLHMAMTHPLKSCPLSERPDVYNSEWSCAPSHCHSIVLRRSTSYTQGT